MCGCCLQFAVTDTAHPYFDMHVDISLAVVEFQESIECSSKPQYMFIGFVHKAAAAMLVPDGNINSQLTKVPGCYGEEACNNCKGLLFTLLPLLQKCVVWCPDV